MLIPVYVSDDGATTIYLTQDGNLYLKLSGQNTEKISGNVSNISYITKNFTCIYYISDHDLYKKDLGKKQEKIASGVDCVIKIYDSGEMYYIKQDNQKINLLGYVEDDMKEEDAAITKPEYPSRPYPKDYSSDEEYQKAYSKYHSDYLSYHARYGMYLDKLSRDRLREDLKDYTISNAGYILCYYNGKEENVLSNTFYYDASYSVSSNTPAIVYKSFDQISFEKIKLSDVSNFNTIEKKVTDALFSSSKLNIAVKDKATTINTTTAENFQINFKGDAVYYMDHISEETKHGELYKVTLKDGIPQTSELYDSKVYKSDMHLLEDGSILYFKEFNVSDYSGDLYRNQKIVDYDVNSSHIDYNQNTDSLVYFINWDYDNLCGTLKLSQHNKSTRIYDNASHFEILPNGEIVFLSDYDRNFFSGNLDCFQNGTIERIDVDVSAIFSYFNT